MIEIFLVPEQTTVTAKGDGAAAEISAAETRVFLLTLNIVDVIEQESLDVSVFGSSDGSAWGEKSLVSFPQKFYRGQHPLLLDLRQQPEIKFLRAHWDVNRWGRGEVTPKFGFTLAAREVPAAMLEEISRKVAG